MRIPLLVTLDQYYLPQLRVLLTSIYLNHPGQAFDVYLIHRQIPGESLKKLSEDCARLDFRLIPIRADGETFRSAKVTDRYPREMYYRLLAGEWLPHGLDKILYLDPDILVINSLNALWEMDLRGYLFAAAAHTGKTEMANSVNKIRLKTNTDYFNSGVLLINLEEARKEIVPDDLFRFVEDNPMALLLPDQDVLNALYGSRILSLDDARWNYDARNYSNYLLRSGGKENLEWVMENTSILHFCGKDKPWKKNYRRRFGSLYRHYMSLTERYLQKDV